MSGNIECEHQRPRSVDVEAQADDSLRKTITAPPSATAKSLKCCIGLDKATGRVKWCPDCEFIKYLLVLPIVLLPIIVTFILLMRISSTFTGRIEIHPITERIIVPLDVEPYHRQTRSAATFTSKLNFDCRSLRHIHSESVDIHEKEIFRDIVRTSFIPSEICMNRYLNVTTRFLNRQIDDPTDNVNELVQTNHLAYTDEFVDQIDFNHLIDEYGDVNLAANLRERRDTDRIDDSDTESSENATEPINFGNKLINDHRIEEKPYEIPAVLKTFWKGGKTYEQIRNSQVEIMKEYMDTSVPPCEDFYQYACGNWEKLNPIPKDKAAYDTFEMLREILDIELNSLLSETDEIEEESQSSTEIFPTEIVEVPNTIDDLARLRQKNREIQKRNLAMPAVGAEQKAKYLYQSCMNSDILEQRKLEPLHELIRSLGGWPVLDDNWDESTFDWLEIAAKLRLYNNDVFMMQWVGPDIKNSEENVIQFDQTSLGLPTRDYFIEASNQQYLEAYQEFARQIMLLCGASANDSKQTAEEIVNFEIELALIMASPEDRANVTQLYRRMTVGILHQNVPEIDWLRYLQVVLEKPIQNNETVVVFALNFMQDLVLLLNRTEPKTIANYMFWKFVRHRINNLDDRFQEAKQKFYNVLIGREKSPPRWKTCVNQVNSNMGMAVGAMFVRKYFDEKSKQDTMAMTHELQQSFRSILNDTDWLDDETKSLARGKVDEMSLKIGYPDYILDSEKLNEKYADLEIHPDKYFENILNVLRHLTRSEQTKLREKVNRTVWNTAPAVVNAYYSRNKNQIMFPAGILQPPFYHRHLPRSLNFGGIGVVIGHEISHGFDDKGRLFDREGNLNRWWSETAIEGFHQRASCLITQYGNYKMNEIGGLAVDGLITQGENIADNGGIKQAFRAYEHWLENSCTSAECIKQEHLHGLNVTNKQLFFINFAQVWCGAMRPEATKNKMKTAVHSPGRFRVIGTLSNSREFAREFQCRLETPMNPQKKCSVW